MSELSSRFIWPMGAELPKPEKLQKILKDQDYMADLKVSGERMSITVGEDCVHLYSRSAGVDDPTRPIELTHRWPEMQHLKNILPTGTVLDGEAFSPIYAEQEIAGFLNSRNKGPTVDGTFKFIAFDIPFLGADSLEDTPQFERRAILLDVLAQLNFGLICPVASVRENTQEFFEHIIASGGEGVVFKHINGKYLQGKKPANVWVKGKKKNTYDCIIGDDFKPGEGKYKNMVGSVGLYQYKPMKPINGIQEVRQVRVCYASGMTDELRQAITYNPTAFIGRVAVVDGYERSRDGINIIQPRIKYIREEGSKSPAECIIEEE